LTSKITGGSCKVLKGTEHFHGKQGLDYGGVISAESVGSQAICMHLVTIPPQTRANAHLHEDHETAIYVISGKAAMWYGENLEEHMETVAGDFVYIPPGVPHLPYNPDHETPTKAVLARTDPNEQESVIMRPDLDNVHDLGLPA